MGTAQTTSRVESNRILGYWHTWMNFVLSWGEIEAKITGSRLGATWEATATDSIPREVTNVITDLWETSAHQSTGGGPGKTPGNISTGTRCPCVGSWIKSFRHLHLESMCGRYWLSGCPTSIIADEVLVNIIKETQGLPQFTPLWIHTLYRNTCV